MGLQASDLGARLRACKDSPDAGNVDAAESFPFDMCPYALLDNVPLATVSF